MDIEGIIKNDSSIRCERTLITNLGKISELIMNEDFCKEDSSRLVISVFLYICDQIKNNPLNVGILDPEQFAAEYNFGRQFLFAQHPRPYQIAELNIRSTYRRSRSMKRKDDNGDNILRISNMYWTTNLENALYVFQNKPINLAMGGAFTENYMKGFTGIDTTIKVSSSIQLLTDIEACYHGQKIIYKFKVNERIIMNICMYYLKLNKNAMLRLLKTNTEQCQMYVHLENIHNVLQMNGEFQTGGSVLIDFDQMCRYLSLDTLYINLESEGERRKFRKRDMNKIFSNIGNVMEDTCGFKPVLSWTKTAEDRGRSAYQPVITFEDLRQYATKNPEHKPSEYYIKQKLKEERIEIFMQQFISHITWAYNAAIGKSIWDDNNSEGIVKWLADESIDEFLKRNAMDSTMRNTYNIIPEDVDKRRHLISLLCQDALKNNKNFTSILISIKQNEDICANIQKRKRIIRPA